MLLNLLAALSLASAGAVAGITSNPLSVNDAALDKSSLIERKNTIYDPVNGKFLNIAASKDDDILFDGYLTIYPKEIFDWSYSQAPSAATVAWTMGNYERLLYVGFLPVEAGSEYGTYNCYLNDNLAGSWDFGTSQYFRTSINIDVTEKPWVVDFDWNNVHVLFLKTTYSLDDYYESHQIVAGIASGLTSVQHYATSLVSGFDALALDNGALTNSMAFAFTLLGIGTAVGICKLTFNWITGRHGM